MQINKLISFFDIIIKCEGHSRHNTETIKMYVVQLNRQYNGHGGFFRTVHEHSENEIFCPNILTPRIRN